MPIHSDSLEETAFMRSLSLLLVLPYAIIDERVFSFSRPGQGGVLCAYQCLLGIFSCQAPRPHVAVRSPQQPRWVSCTSPSPSQGHLQWCHALVITRATPMTALYIWHLCAWGYLQNGFPEVALLQQGDVCL